jgi:hypothetical protein
VEHERDDPDRVRDPPSEHRAVGLPHDVVLYPQPRLQGGKPSTRGLVDDDGVLVRGQRLVEDSLATPDLDHLGLVAERPVAPLDGDGGVAGHPATQLLRDPHGLDLAVLDETRHVEPGGGAYAQENGGDDDDQPADDEDVSEDIPETLRAGTRRRELPLGLPQVPLQSVHRLTVLPR